MANSAKVSHDTLRLISYLIFPLTYLLHSFWVTAAQRRISGTGIKRYNGTYLESLEAWASR